MEKLKGSLSPSTSSSFESCFDAQLTFVAIDPKAKRPYKNVPKLHDPANPSVAALAAEVQADKAASRAVDASIAKLDARDAGNGHVPGDERPPAPPPTPSSVTIDHTLVELRKQYLPRHENFGGIVFGGDLLMLLERAALYCARRFSGRKVVSCVRMHSIHFRLPVEPAFLLVTRARVVRVGEYAVDVEVVGSIDRTHEGRGMQVSHTGYFTLVSRCSQSGAVLPVPGGLDVAASSADAVRAYHKARLRRDHVVGDEDESKFLSMFV